MASVPANWILTHTRINCLGIRKVYFLSPAHIMPFDNQCRDSFFLLLILVEGVEKSLLLVINIARWENILPPNPALILSSSELKKHTVCCGSCHSK